MSDGQPVRELDQPGPFRDLVFSPNGLLLATASEEGAVGLWRLGSISPSTPMPPPRPTTMSSTTSFSTPLAITKVPLAGHNDAVTGLAFSPDSRLLASSSVDWSIRLWGVDSGQQAAALSDYAGRFWYTAFSPDGRLLASVSDDGIVRLWGIPASEAP